MWLMTKHGDQGRIMIRLNLGSGLRPVEGFVNIDSNPALKPDLVRDLCRGLPYSDGTVDEIQGMDVLEHLPGPADLIFVLNECHRVLHSGGRAIFCVPNCLSFQHSDWAFGDPTHRIFFCVHTWDYWQAGHEQHEFNGSGYGILPWTIHLEIFSGDAIIRATMEPVKIAVA